MQPWQLRYMEMIIGIIWNIEKMGQQIPKARKEGAQSKI